MALANKLLEQGEDRQLVPVYGPRQDIVSLKHGEPEVRSDAEVKHGTVHFLAHFSPLQMNTNLNIPPSNWLRSSSELEKHVRDLTWQRKSSEFSSIQMAHNSLDIAGEVDVISNAANIKKLLKMPFEKSHISMMVHRVGKSVLLDEFDIHKHLLRQEKNEWHWLRQFYRDSIVREYQERHMKCVPRQSKSRDSLQNRNMYSKFLYHSVCEAPNQLLTQEEIEAPLEEDTNMFTDDPRLDQSLLPDPLPQPQPKGSQFQQETLWTFEDIKMLIGTDLPVFRNDSYYVSLRLREMRTPINVLTGLDYWLDNLMCNVPEVAMCFHLDGIVQKYELIRTEDIPHLENSTFDPRKVTDIAKNILSFLKNNATKEGHTYWLYKGVDDDVVKLYDLTALCEDEDTSEQNPFTVPLGMLLYRVARNMWESKEPGKAALIQTLLETCLYLLDDKKHSQVCTSACYLLSDLYVPDTVLKDDWSLPGNSSSTENSDDESAQDWEDLADESDSSVDVGLLSKAGSVPRANESTRLKRFITDPELRCQEALKQVCKGLTCLSNDLSCQDGYNHKKTSIVEEQAQCHSDEAIPLHYEPLHQAVPPSKNNKSHSSDNRVTKGQQKGSRKGRNKVDIKQAAVKKGLDLQMSALIPDDASWHSRSKGLLLKKAALMFMVKVKQHLTATNYIEAFKYLRASFLCYNGLKNVLPHQEEKTVSLLGSLYSLAGDIRLFLGKLSDTIPDWDTVFKNQSDEELNIVYLAEQEIKKEEFDWILKTDTMGDENLVICVRCYRKALDLTSKSMRLTYDPVAKRLGNALNELGVWYMHQSQIIIQGEEMEKRPTAEVEQLWLHAKDSLSQGLDIFIDIVDEANQALLHCNYGRLMRLSAQTYTHIALKSNTHEFSKKERYYFDQALDHYQQALSLGEHGFKSICESVTWELSTTYFNMATLLQDYAPFSSTSKQEIEQEVITLMNKSLKYCRSDEKGSASQPMYQFRAATIHHRLASLYHNSLRNCSVDEKRKRLRHLSESHYEKSLNLFKTMECHTECLRVQLEYLALLDYFLSAQNQSKIRQRQLLQMLHRLGDCSLSLRGFTSQLEESGDSLQGEGETISRIIESRVQFILLQLVKTYTIGSVKKSQEKPAFVAELKQVYRESLSVVTVKKEGAINKDQTGACGDQTGACRDQQGSKGDQVLPSVYQKCVRLQKLLDEIVKLYERSVSQEHDPS